MNLESQRQLMLRCIIGCFVVYMAFPQFIPEKASNALILAGTLLSLAFSMKGGFHRIIKLQQVALLLFWLLFAIYAMISCLRHHGLRPYLTLALLLFVLVMLFSAVGTDWIGESVDICIFMLSIYSVSTIVLCVFPDLYAPIKSAFFAAEVNATDYKSGLTTHYSNNGTYNAIGFIISSCMFLFRKELPKKRLYGLAAACFFVALFLTTKRAHLLYGFAAVLVVYLTSTNRGRFGKALLVVGVGLAVIEAASAFIPAVADTILRITGTFGASRLDEVDNGRSLLWDFAISGWQNSPIFGNGWTSYFFVWPDGFTTTIIAHNELYNLLYECGIFGTSFAIVLIAASLVFTFSAVAKYNNSVFAPFLRMAVSLQIFALVYGFTSGSLTGAQYYFMPYFFAIGIVVACNIARPLRQEAVDELDGERG